MPTTPTTPATPTPSRREVLRWSSAGLAALALPSLSGCGSSSAQGDTQTTVQLIHASQDPLVLWAVTYLAEDMGFYEEEGLSVERIGLGGGPAAMAGLLAGEGDANLSAPGELLAATDQGQQLRVLMAHTNRMPSILVVSKELADSAGITADSSLPDRQEALARVDRRRLGITAPGSQTDAFSRLALRQAGLDPDRDAQIVPLQTAGNMLAALENDQIDGYIGVPPIAEQAMLSLDAVPLLVNQTGEIEGADRFQGMTLQARASDVEANPDLYAALVRADVHAMQALVEDPASAGDMLRETRFDALDEAVWNLAWELIQPAWQSPILTREWLQAWFDAGVVASTSDAPEFPFDDVIDMQYVEQALDELGWSPPQL